MPPHYNGQIWYRETLTLLENGLAGRRLDFIANEVQSTVRAAHEQRGWSKRPRVLPEAVLQEAVRRGYLSDEEALRHWRWHRQEQARKERLARDISPNLRAEIERRDGGRCQYCGKAGRTLDHLIPISRGGLSVRLNLLTACETCNRAKGTKMLPEETVTVIRFFLKRDRTVENGYPHMTELVKQFFEQLAQKGPLEQARIRGIVGIKKSRVMHESHLLKRKKTTLTDTRL